MPTMIPRSKSAPKPLSEIAPLATSHLPPRPRLRMSRTALTTPAATPLASPRGIREDPFSLTGFFPSSQSGGENWSWVRSESPEGREEPDEDEDGASAYPDYSVLSTPRDGNNEERSSYDEFAKQVIDGEDKFGMLAFSSEKLPSLLRSKMPVFERPTSPVHVSSLVVDEAVDLDALHRKLCSRRETLASEGPEGGEIGQLFFSGEEEKKEDGWAMVVYLRLMSLVSVGRRP